MIVEPNCDVGLMYAFQIEVETRRSLVSPPISPIPPASESEAASIPDNSQQHLNQQVTAHFVTFDTDFFTGLVIYYTS